MREWNDQTIFFIMIIAVWALLNLRAILWWTIGIDWRGMCGRYLDKSTSNAVSPHPRPTWSRARHFDRSGRTQAVDRFVRFH